MGLLIWAFWLVLWVVVGDCVFMGPLMVEFLGGWNGLWAMGRTRFVGYSGWLADFGLFFFFFFPFSNLWILVVSGVSRGWVFANLVVVWVVGGVGLVVWFSEIVKILSFC